MASSRGRFNSDDWRLAKMALPDCSCQFQIARLSRVKKVGVDKHGRRYTIGKVRLAFRMTSPEGLENFDFSVWIGTESFAHVIVKIPAFPGIQQSIHLVLASSTSRGDMVRILLSLVAFRMRQCIASLPRRPMASSSSNFTIGNPFSRLTARSGLPRARNGQNSCAACGVRRTLQRRAR